MSALRVSGSASSPKRSRAGDFFIHMEKLFLSANGKTVDVQDRLKIHRDDVEMHIALFSRHMESACARNEDAFRDFCISSGIEDASLRNMRIDLIVLFAEETHYKRRNKLSWKVQQIPSKMLCYTTIS